MKRCPSRGEIRSMLKELGRATIDQLAAALDAAEYRQRISTSLSDCLRGGDAWLVKDGKAEMTRDRGNPPVIWRYVDQVEKALGKEPKSTFGPPFGEASAQKSYADCPLPAGWSWPRPALSDFKPNPNPWAKAAQPEPAQTPTLDKILALLEAQEARLQRLEAASKPDVLRGLLQTELSALEQRLLEAFGGSTPAAEPEPPTVGDCTAPTETKRLPKVLVFRVDAVKAQRLKSSYGGILDLTVHTDMADVNSAAQRLAARKWDLVVLTAWMLGHQEKRTFELSGSKLSMAYGGFHNVVNILDSQYMMDQLPPTEAKTELQSTHNNR